MVLVDAKGHATYVERTMNDDATDPHDARNWELSTYEFDIQNTEDSVGYVTEKATEILQSDPLLRTRKNGRAI